MQTEHNNQIKETPKEALFKEKGTDLFYKTPFYNK